MEELLRTGLPLCGPFFTHQLSHSWIGFRGIQDAFMRTKGIDYFENGRRATYVQRQHAIDNSLKFEAYGRDCWGITASEGPGPVTRTVHGIERRFSDAVGRRTIGWHLSGPARAWFARALPLLSEKSQAAAAPRPLPGSSPTCIDHPALRSRT